MEKVRKRVSNRDKGKSEKMQILPSAGSKKPQGLELGSAEARN